MENKIIYTKENKENFFAKIEELTDKNQFLACIEALESISEEERDYRINYQLARAYQNFAIVGENEKETEYELGSELLKTSISILLSVKEEGENKAEWNMRMAYGYQYLEDQEEKAIPYALRWAELDPSDKAAILVVEECKQEIKNRERNQVLFKVYEIVEQILKDYKIKDSQDYCHRDDKELDEIDEKIYLATKDFAIVDEEDIVDVIDNVLEDFENNKKNSKGESMKKCLWEENGYYAKNCTDKPLTDEMVAEAEKELGYKLPQAYIDLMKRQNGGKLIKNYWVNEYAKSNEVDVIGLECFYSIGSEKENSLFGEFSNEFWFTEWEYPRDMGVIIADTESGGHHMIYLDYRDCGKEGEPKVSVCFQESDYRMQVLANNFEEFLSMLVSEAEIEQDI